MSHQTEIQCSPRRTAVLLVALSLAGATPAARAADGARERANALFQSGRKLYAGGDYSGALDRFQRARALYPSYKLELSIGYALEALERLPEAAVHFELFLNQASGSASAKLVDRIRAKMQKLQRLLASVAVQCDTPDATVAVDGAPVGRAPLGHRIYLPPGAYRLSVKKAGYIAFSREVSLNPGETARLSVELVPEAPPPVAAMGGQPTADPRPTPIYKTWWFWTAVGAVVAGAAAGGYAATQFGGSDRLPSGDLGTIRLDR